jgi:hypothetical protein
MRKLSLIIFLILTSNFSFSQKFEVINLTDSLKTNITNDLKQSNVKDILFLVQTSPSVQKVVYEDLNIEKSYVDFTAYAFWNENSKNYVQKFDRLGKFNKLEITEFKGLELLSKNLEQINSENVFPFKIGKNIIVSPNEYSYELDVQYHNHNFKKIFYKFNLQKSEFVNGIEKDNTNYLLNNDLQLIRLFKLCEIVVDNLNIKNLRRI